MDEILDKYSSQVVTVKVDVRHQENLDETLKSFVNTKGKLHGSVLDLRMFEEKELTRIMEVNFFGAVKFLRACLQSDKVRKIS